MAFYVKLHKPMGLLFLPARVLNCVFVWMFRDIDLWRVSGFFAFSLSGSSSL
ncbi:hypothetical protein HanIR_Chr03g0100271 [Helianthus annuus]|nr:hypothetical protein HanIR_Chr03g0100271 [Helianthus annuus]